MEHTISVPDRKLIKCTYCGEKLDEEEAERPSTDGNGDIICDECYEEEFMEECGLCDNLFDKPEKPEDHYFIVPKGLISGMMGLYQGKEYPFYFGDCLSGFNAFFEQNIELIRAIDINSMLKTLWGKHACLDVIVDICPECVNKYTKTSGFATIRNNYVDHAYGLDFTINKRGVYQLGR